MKNILVIFLFLLMGCAVNKENVGSKNNIKKDYIETTIKQTESNIFFIIKNQSNKDITLLQPEKINVEYFDNNNWSKLRILSCPCGAPCAKPLEEIIILPGKEYSINWNKLESWCGKKNVEGIKETIYQELKEGKYRLKLIYKTKEEKEVKVLYKDFQI